MASEDVAELGEDVFHRHSAAGVITASAAEASAEALRTHRVTELVILLALLVVGEYFVSLGRFLELILGRFVARIFVRVIFDGQLSVGLLYFICRGGLADPKHFIIISFILHRVRKLTEYYWATTTFA